MTGCTRTQRAGATWPCDDAPWGVVLGSHPRGCPLAREYDLPDDTDFDSDDVSGFHAFLLGVEAMGRGLVADALAHYRSAVTSQIAIGANPPWRRSAELGLGYTATLIEGGRAPTPSHSGHLIAQPDEPRSPQRAISYLLSAWRAAAMGHLDVATQRALEGASEARDADLPGREMLLLHLAVRLGNAGPAVRLAQLSGQYVCQFARLAAAHAEALHTRDGQRLDTVATCFAQAGMPLEALDARCHAVVALRASGAPTAAWEVFLRAQAERRARQRPTTPAWQLAYMRLPLTDREREIATMTATGLTREAIARRLAMSHQSVEQLIREIYHKLRVSDRQALANAIASEADV